MSACGRVSKIKPEDSSAAVLHTVQQRLWAAAELGPGHTFAEYLLADAACPAVLDRPMTTVHVEEGILGHVETAEQEQSSTYGRAYASRCPAGHAAEAASAPVLRHLLETAHVVVHWVLVRHLGCDCGRRPEAQHSCLSAVVEQRCFAGAAAELRLARLQNRTEAFAGLAHGSAKFFRHPPSDWLPRTTGRWSSQLLQAGPRSKKCQ